MKLGPTVFKIIYYDRNKKTNFWRVSVKFHLWVPLIVFPTPVCTLKWSCTVRRTLITTCLALEGNKIKVVRGTVLTLKNGPHFKNV